jgi:Raf kinase inhibitor-like YbhB/YbcL family protein
VRRVVLLSLIPVAAMLAAACNDDGRTLREPRPDQTQSISTLASTTEGDVIDTVQDTTDGSVVDTTAVGDTASLPGGDENLILTAPWAAGEAIDPRFTCDGDNIAPALQWTAAPEGTVEIAITMRDMNSNFQHWGIAGISPEQTSLEEDTVPLGAYEARNGAGDIGYAGPCPPSGSTHTYVITVHYLGSSTNLTDGVAGSELVDGIAAAELASVEVEGTFSRG